MFKSESVLSEERTSSVVGGSCPSHDTSLGRPGVSRLVSVSGSPVTEDSLAGRLLVGVVESVQLHYFSRNVGAPNCFILLP